MDVKNQVRARSPSSNAPPRRGRTKRIVLLSVGAFGFTMLGTGSFLNHDRDLDGVLAPKKALATLPTRSEVQAENAFATSTVEAPWTTFESDGNGIQDRTRLVADRLGAAFFTTPTAGRSFGIGDRLKITFYERLAAEDDKWGRAASALRGIQQRPELSGEFAVQEDGTISVPLLGSVTVAAKSEQAVQADLADTFEKVLGRKGIVNVLLLERPPVYVLGPVKNPGSFKYVPGMTVLHVLALAGGIDRDRGSNEPWQKIEAVREIQKRSGAIDSMLKLLARQSVLRAERDGTTPKIPPRLLKLVGATEAASLIDEQGDRRRAIAMTRRDRERAALSAVESAKQDLRMYARTDSLDDLVKIRQERVDNLRSLVDKNLTAKSTLSQVQAELSDAEQRRQDAFNQYSMAKQRLAQIEQEALRARSDVANDLTAEIDLTDRQIADNEREFDTSEGILSTLPATRTRFAESASKDPNQIGYLIVRQTPNGPVKMESSGMTVLQPGDLVDIVMGAGDSAERSQPDRNGPASKPNKEVPIERASRQEIGNAMLRED
jgi:polysaccharide biosynthesis/export protein ExoF